MDSLTPKEWFILGIAALWIYSAAVSSLPQSTEQSSTFYTWFYAFLKRIAGDLSATFGKYIPNTADLAKKEQK